MERRLRLVAFGAALLGALIAAPITVIASHQFLDVPTNHQFHEAIDWLAAEGITYGCNPPANTEFCPDDFVTRGQMAAFLKRSAEAQNFRVRVETYVFPVGETQELRTFRASCLPGESVVSGGWYWNRLDEPLAGNGANDYPPGRPERNTWRVDVLDTFGPPNIPWTVFAVCAD